MEKSKIKWLWIIGAVFVAMQYFICFNVYLMGDDYMYGTFGHEGIISPILSYYQTGNGRWLINILDSFQLLFDRYLYLIITPWLLLLLGILIYRFICILTSKDEKLLFAIVVGLLALIDIQMTCETTYWITGAMNYLVPAILFVAGLIATLKLRKEELAKKNTIIYSILCVFSCLTMEQFGLMAIGWMLMVWGYDCIKNKKVNKRNLIIFGVSFLALFTIIFAPGNFVRVGDATEKGTSIFIKIIDLIYYDYYSKVSSTFLFIMAAICSVRFYKVKKRIMALLSALNAVILLIFFDYGLLNASFPLVVISILISLITIIPIVFSVFKKISIPHLMALAIVGSGSQLMLLATQLWGYRTSLSCIIIYIIGVLSILSDDLSPKNIGITVSLLCIAVNPYLSIVGVIICGFFIFSKKPSTLVVTSLMILVIIIVGLSDEVIGYQENRDVHVGNIESAISANSDKDTTKITIQAYDDERYGWTSPPLSEFHEQYFRSYYRLPENVIIEYERD